MAMNLDDLKKLPLKIKILIIFLVCVLIGYFYYMFFLQDALSKMMALETKRAETTAADCGKGKDRGAA